MSTPLRTLFVSHDAGMAGAQQTLLTLLQEIDKKRFECRLAVPNDGELERRSSELGIPVARRAMRHWCPCVGDLRSANRWTLILDCVKSLRARSWAIARFIEQHSIQIVYTNTVTVLEGAIAARMTGRPHVWHIHEPISGNSELLPLFPSRLYYYVINTLSDHIIFPSHALSRDYPTLGKHASVVHNGLKFSAPRNRASSRAEVARVTGIDPSKKWIAIVGALQPRKDHITFLNAAREIVKDRQDTRFLIVGAGTKYFSQALQDRVEAMDLGKFVTLCGRWAGPIETMLSAVDVLAISSEQESFGLTAIEALAMETPVVATRCGGPEEIIDAGVNGLLVDVKDGAAMAEAILKILADPGMASAFGRAGRAKVTDSFTERLYVKSIENILAEVFLIHTSSR